MRLSCNYAIYDIYIYNMLYIHTYTDIIFRHMIHIYTYMQYILTPGDRHCGLVAETLGSNILLDTWKYESNIIMLETLFLWGLL